jgi:hypothetical protein
VRKRTCKIRIAGIAMTEFIAIIIMIDLTSKTDLRLQVQKAKA